MHTCLFQHCPAIGMQNCGCWENLKRRNLLKIQYLLKLQNMQIMGEIINNNNILKTWNRNFVRPTGVHNKQCVSLSAHSFSFHTFLLALDTD